MQQALTIRGTDGDLGRLNQFYFDDQHWGIRYLVIDTSSWLEGRNVLLPPLAIMSINWPARSVDVELTKDQIKHSPDISQHKPVSRQHELEYFNYYGWPYYWSYSELWGAGFQPSSMMMERAIEDAQENDPTLRSESGDPHLRSSREVMGYHINAHDGEIGHVEDLLIDDEVWTIERLIVDTRNWWHGKNVLISPQQIRQVDWANANVDVNLTTKQIKDLKEFDGSAFAKRSPQRSVPAELF